MNEALHTHSLSVRQADYLDEMRLVSSDNDNVMLSYHFSFVVVRISYLEGFTLVH